jgi:hypothetical protein
LNAAAKTQYAVAYKFITKYVEQYADIWYNGYAAVTQLYKMYICCWYAFVYQQFNFVFFHFYSTQEGGKN